MHAQLKFTVEFATSDAINVLSSLTDFISYK